MPVFGDVYEYRDGARIMVVGQNPRPGWLTTVVLTPGFIMAGLHTGALHMVTAMALRTSGWTKLTDGAYQAAVIDESPSAYWPLGVVSMNS